MSRLPGAAEAARAIAAGRTTSQEVVAACLARIAEREETVRAWAFLDPELALAQARACDAAAEPAGPLHGVPVGIKDIFDTADMPTAMGSPIYRGHRPAADAAAVAILRQAGAVILGKTATAEFAGTHPGPTTNPHDAPRAPGGSVLRRSSYCGIFGFKPSFGTTARAGIKFAAESLDTVGLHARELDDIALLAGVRWGREPRRPGSDSAAPRSGTSPSPRRRRRSRKRPRRPGRRARRSTRSGSPPPSRRSPMRAGRSTTTSAPAPWPMNGAPTATG